VRSLAPVTRANPARGPAGASLAGANLAGAAMERSVSLLFFSLSLSLSLKHHRPPSLYPPWSAEQLFWASGNQGSFFNPLSLPPALTALSMNFPLKFSSLKTKY
jgi:hypothetical protein